MNIVKSEKNKEFEFEVIGDIKGKARPRVNTYTCQVYTPNNTKDYENLVKQYFKIHYPNSEPSENRVFVKITAYFKIPKNTSKKDLKLIEEGILSPTKKPDIDNVVKIVLDALNKLAFKDDNQITKLEVEKCYTMNNEEKLHIKVMEY